MTTQTASPYPTKRLKQVEAESHSHGYACLDRDFVNAVDASMFSYKMPPVEWGLVGIMPVLIPRRHRQRAVADYLDRETARLDKPKSKIQDAIAFVKKRLAALIVVVIAGRIDVENAA